MNRMLPAKLALAAVLLPTIALAKTSDRNEPMAVESTVAVCDVGENGTCHFTGDVVITQGTLVIHADRADVFRKDGEFDRAVLVGKQATMKQLMDDGSPMHAAADNIEYKIPENQIILTGNYKIESPRGSNAGQHMVYNTETGVMQSGGDGTRVHTVLQPKSKAASGNTQGNNK